jgi:GNAT superfamily N-acetyltransferase
MRPLPTARDVPRPAGAPILYAANRSAIRDITAHLLHCDAYFVPPLSSRVDIEAYAAKIASQSERFEAWAGPALAGLVAAYCNDPSRHAAFITSVSVLPERRGAGIATRLLRDCIEHARGAGFTLLGLRVGRSQTTAMRLYGKCGFSAAGPAAESDVTMTLELNQAAERHA